MTDPTPATPEQSEPTMPAGPAVPAMPAQRTEFEPLSANADATVANPAHAHDPWSREAETVAVPASGEAPGAPGAPLEMGTQVEMGTYAMSGLPGGEVAGAPVKRRHRTRLVLILSAVLIVLVGAGAFAAAKYIGYGIVEPETAVPASVSAFMRIDLSPGLRDELAFNSLVKKFPRDGKSTQDLVTTVEKKASTSAGLSYDTDVKPWFGGRAGIAEWTNAAGKPVALIVLASKNDGAAKTALAKVQKREGEDFGFVLSNGYAIIAGEDTGAQADAVAAAAAAKSHNLADSASYKSALSHISGHNLVIGYADLGSLSKLMSTELQSEGGAGLTGLAPDNGSIDPLLSMFGGSGSQSLSGSLSKLTGTIIVGGSVVSDGVEVHAHTQDLGTAAGSTASTNVRSTLDAMPDTTTFGFATDGLDPNSATVKQLMQTLGSSATALEGGPDGSDAGSAAMLQALTQPLTSILTAKVISLAVTGISGGLPSGFLAIDTRDAASAQSIMSTITELTGGGAVPGVDIKNDGTHIQATMGGPVSTSKLSGSSLYTETTKGMSNEQSMVYIDVQKIVALVQANGGDISASDKAQIAPVKSIGMGVTSSGTSTDAVVRVIIK